MGVINNNARMKRHNDGDPILGVSAHEAEAARLGSEALLRKIIVYHVKHQPNSDVARLSKKLPGILL